MPIIFPDFNNAHCLWMTLCAAAPKAPNYLVKWMRQEGQKVAAYKTERGTAHVRLILGGNDGNHIHFDVYSPEIVSKRPKRARGKSTPLIGQGEIQKSISRLFGQEINGRLRVGYTATLNELPATGIIRAFAFETNMGTVALKLDGALFSIKGAPIQEIAWNSQPDGNIAVTIESQAIKTTISEDYLTKLNNMTDAAFNVFILGRSSSESK